MTNYPSTLITKKQNGDKITILTAYDAPTATLLSTQDIDAILVGDSLGNVIAGHPNTLPVTIDHIIYHTQMVVRGAPQSLIIADMPFMSYPNTDTGVINAGRLLKEGGATAVKIETNRAHVSLVSALTDQGIAVLSHVGFTPQFLVQLGGYKIQGKTQDAANALEALCLELENAGSFGIVLEMIPATLAQKITQKLKIPTIGIGAGPHCDGQILVTADLLGMTDKKPPKFVKQYAQLHPIMAEAIAKFKTEVTEGLFPNEHTSF